MKRDPADRILEAVVDARLVIERLMRAHGLAETSPARARFALVRARQLINAAGEHALTAGAELAPRRRRRAA